MADQDKQENPSAAVRRARAKHDIEAVRRQVSEGELDPETAEMLIRRYQSEIEQIDHTSGRPDTNAGATPSTPSRSRRMVGTLLLIIAFVAVSITAYLAIRPREGGFITGDVEGSVDLSQVTNDQMEAVIAANPDVPEIATMRISLADRYFDEGAFSDALPHYLGALDGTLDRTRRARGLARVGWMSFLSGAEEIAEVYVGEALEIDPDYLEAQLFLGLIRLDRRDGDGTLDLLEPLLARDDLPTEVRRTIEGAVGEARDLIESESDPEGRAAS